MKSENDTAIPEKEEKNPDTMKIDPLKESKWNPQDIGRFLSTCIIFIFIWIVLTIVGQRIYSTCNLTSRVRIHLIRVTELLVPT